jgi:hypothetical protein
MELAGVANALALLARPPACSPDAKCHSKSLSACEGGAEVESLYLTACMHLGRANELDACSSAALNNWGASLSRIARRTGRDEALPLLHEIIFKHRNCLAIEPQNAEYTCNLTDTVAEMAALLSGPASDNLYQEAYGMWEQVLQQLQGTVNLTDRGDATVNYGNALVAHAARLSDGATGAYDLRCDFLLPHLIDSGSVVAAMQGFLAAEH